MGQDATWQKAFYAALASGCSDEVDAKEYAKWAAKVADAAVDEMTQRDTMPQDDHIESIIPCAPGWRALYVEISDDPKPLLVPVAAWALVRNEFDDGVNTSVRPLVAEGPGLGTAPHEDMVLAESPEILAPGQEPDPDALTQMLARAMDLKGRSGAAPE